MSPLELKQKGLIVDPQDEIFLEINAWQITNKNDVMSHVYERVNGEKVSKTIYLSRMLTGCPENMTVDHINGNKLDNRRANLRVCSHIENCQNRGKRIDNTSGFKGVTETPYKTFQAAIRIHGKRYFLGTFKSAESAARAYDKKAKELQGQFANLNFPNE